MQIKEIENIEPQEVMKWFKKICAIPHGSYHEEKISKWVADVCKKAGCKVKVYPSGMILAKQEASKGCEDWPVVLLQSHLDMVLAKTDKADIDLLKEPVEPYYDSEDDQIKANHTSLGGDDGIGVSMQLAIMHNPKIIHGPIEHLFTVNEEDHPGECVLNDLKMGDLTAKYYINLDSEKFDELTYGGAGCTTMKFNNEIPLVANKEDTFNVSLTGLKGGHSGINVHQPHINAIEFLAQCAYDFGTLNKIKFSIARFDGGPINNSLPIYAKMDVVMEQKQFVKFKRFCINQLLIAKKVAQGLEDDAVLAFEKVETAKKVCSPDLTGKILAFASLSPNKVFTSLVGRPDMFSSSNLGFISIEGGKLRADFKVRSFVDGDIEKTIRKIAALGKILGFTKYTREGQLFAFINDIKQNTVAHIWQDVYKEVTGKPINCLAVCAGLECASICTKNPKMISNTISVNTTLFNCHSPSEGVSIADTVKFWKILKIVLTKLVE